MAGKKISKKRKQNAKWDPFSTKILIEVCMDEVRSSGTPFIAFENERWKVVVDKFNRRADENYNEKQLKYKMDNLRNDWLIWKQLVEKETGLWWNHQTGTIEADATWWEAKIRDNPKFAKFRYQALEFRDDLDFVFDETVATSQDTRTPNMGTPNELSGGNTASDMPQKIVDSDDGKFNLDEEFRPVESSHHKRKKAATQGALAKATTGKAKFGTAGVVRKTLEHLVQAAEIQNKFEKEEIASTSFVNGQYSIPNCIEVLKTLKDGGLLNGGQFGYAVELLKNSQNRVILMSLEDSIDALVDWILYKYDSGC